MQSFLLLLFCIPLLVQGQYSSNFQQEYFFGNLPHARTEAMGKAGVALGGSTASLFQNPATLGMIQGWDAVISTSGPFYVLKESDYYFVGASRRLNDKWVTAISLNQFAIGPTTFDVNLGGTRYPAEKPVSSNLAISGAGEILPGLQAGLNLNVFRWTYLDAIPATHQVHLDGGLLYRLALPQPTTGKRELLFGLSVTNLANNKIEFFGPAGEENKQAFPIVLCLGGTFHTQTMIELPTIGKGPLELTLTTEYQNVLNNDYRTALRLGTEVVIWEVFAFRLGAFTTSNDNLGNDVNKSRLNDITYGFGFRVPAQKLSKGKVPFNLHVDYVSLEPIPVRVTGGTRLPNFRTFTFGFVWALSSTSSSSN